MFSRSSALAVVFLLAGTFSRVLWGLDIVVDVSAVASTQPTPKLTLNWTSVRNFGTTFEGHTVYRKALGAKEWGEPVAKLDGRAVTYEDTALKPGQAYEYQVVREMKLSDQKAYNGYGYLAGGIEVAAIEARGKVIVLVDARHAEALRDSLAILEQDLVGDGWTMIRHDVAAGMKDTEIKAILKKEHDKDPENVRAVLIVGHVTVPYSGNIVPDGHTDHHGSWPADMFYGDLAGTWTDATVDTTANGELRSPTQKNLPNDGKWDQDHLPENGEVALEIGRVDMHALPTLPAGGKLGDEAELLKKYLAKDHRYRHNLSPFDSVRRRALFDDSYIPNPRLYLAGMGTPEALVGADAVDVADFMETLPHQSYLWSFGLRSGDYNRINGILRTSDLETANLKTVFTMLFGSWSGDWDSPHNIMRAAIASGDYTLTSCWGAPKWYFHPMAMGHTIGYCAKITQNNRGHYANPAGGGRLGQTQAMIHIALLGDPTLRLFPVTPPTGLQIQRNANDAYLRWTPSKETVAGYHVYRQDAAGEAFHRVTTDPVTFPAFLDKKPLAAGTTYMVRALKLETSGGGTFWNLSQGLFGKQF